MPVVGRPLGVGDALRPLRPLRMPTGRRPLIAAPFSLPSRENTGGNRIETSPISQKMLFISDL